jgi:hypothetical protein
VVGSEGPLADLERPLEVFKAVPTTHVGERAAERVVELGLDHRLVGKGALELCGRDLEQVGHGERLEGPVRGAPRRGRIFPPIPARRQVYGEIGNPGGNRVFVEIRDPPRATRFHERRAPRHGRCHNSRDENDHDDSRGRDQRFVASREDAQVIHRRRRARRDRLGTQESADVGGEARRRRVAIFAALLHRGARDRLDVAAQLAVDLAERRGIDLPHAPHCLGDRHAVDLDRRMAGEQLVEQDSEGVHIGARVDPFGVERALLG